MLGSCTSKRQSRDSVGSPFDYKVQAPFSPWGVSFSIASNTPCSNGVDLTPHQGDPLVFTSKPLGMQFPCWACPPFFLSPLFSLLPWGSYLDQLILQECLEMMKSGHQLLTQLSLLFREPSFLQMCFILSGFTDKPRSDWQTVSLHKRLSVALQKTEEDLDLSSVLLSGTNCYLPGGGLFAIIQPSQGLL